MGLLLFRVFLFINAFNIATENPIYKYRFDVYPVDTCPMNATDFESAARRRNCTGGSRYLCAPDKDLSSLIEFCTDRVKLFYEKGNCVRLEGSGDLNHYNCVDRFTSGCPTEPYQDDKIFEYPMCLVISREFKCFISEKGCSERIYNRTELFANNSTEGDKRNKGIGEDFNFFPVIFTILLTVSSAVLGTTMLIFWKEKKKENRGYVDMKRISYNTLQKNENKEAEGLLKDVSEDETNVKEIQKDENDDVNENAIREYLSKGELTMSHIRCIIVGCAHAGKTTLLRRLKNIPCEELKNIMSTEIIDVHVNIFEVNQETIQCVEGMNEMPAIIIPSNLLENKSKSEPEKYTDKNVQAERGSAESVQEKTNSGTSSMEENEIEQDDIADSILKNRILLDSFETEQSKTDAKDREIMPNSPDKNPSTSRENSLFLTNESTTIGHVAENYAISKIMDAVKQLSKERDIRPRITFLDFAGQSLYYAFHQIYLSPKTCYILVMDMTKGFKERVPDSGEQCASRFASWTYEEYYKFWLKSVDSFSDTEAPVVIVGTRADELSKDDCSNFFRTFYDLVNHHFDLRRHLNRKRQFTIGFPDNKLYLDELENMKKCIASLVHDPEKIQPVWAMFEHILEKEKTRKIITRELLSNINENIGQEFRMTDEDIKDMLLFFHRVGTLLYFDEDQLRETIILDVQWFAQAFKCIVAYDVDIRKNDDKRERFLHTGEIDDHELNGIWEKKDSRYLSYKSEIIPYMEQLGLLAECKTEKGSFYYIPSMNRRKFNDNQKMVTKSSVLCFQFDKNGQLPVFLFYGIVIKCTKIPGWSILREKGENCIYDKVACFSFRRLIVVMCLCKFQIQVQLRVPAQQEIDRELSDKVQQLIEEKIEEFQKYSFQVGYKCENGIFNDENEDSCHALEDFLSMSFCSHCSSTKPHYLNKENCWKQMGHETMKRDIGDIGDDKGYQNFARIVSIILGPVTDLLQCVLAKEIGSQSLIERVRDYFATPLTTKRFVINKHQETLLHEGDYSKFDVSLLYFLLRNVCAIPPHVKGWGNRPMPEDKSVSANIERIRFIRNQFAHTSSFSHYDFDGMWQELFDIIQQLETYTGTSPRYQDAAREMKTRPLDTKQSVLKILSHYINT